MSFHRYPKYKPSDASWFDLAPAHWTVLPIKRLSPVRRGASPRPIDDPKFFDEDGEFGWVRITDVSKSGGTLRETEQRLSNLGRSLSVPIAPGELFISIAGTVGKPCISAIKACIHDGFVYFPELHSNPRWLYRLFESGVCHGGLGKKGTQLNLNTDTIGSIRVPLPPEPEMEGILRFIDDEVARIDALIAEQQRLMDLLSEKRHALISHAVTKGLNPDAPMKASGLAWPDEVPAHWHWSPIKRHWHVIDCKHITPEFVSDGIPLASIREVQGRWVDLEKAKQTTREFYQQLTEGGRKPRIGDLVFSRNATVGEVAQVGPQHPAFAMGQDVVLLRSKEAGFSSDFLQHAIRSSLVTRQLDTLMIGSTFKRINVEEVRSLVILWPPPQEQVMISEQLDAASESLDALRAEAERAVELLQERRTALISAAVTGQIDVRELAAVEVV